MVSVRIISSWAVLFTWLLKILNSIIELEAIPSTLKCGSITPIYKGGGKDPLDQNSYRGITVASVMAKVLESLILGRLNTVLLEVGVTHVNPYLPTVPFFAGLSRFLVLCPAVPLYLTFVPLSTVHPRKIILGTP